MQAETIALALGGKRVGEQWMAPCPAHEDTDPSLSIRNADDGKVLVHCHAGCEQSGVIGELRSRGLWNSAGDLLDLSSPRRPNKIDACLKKKGYFELSLEQAICESGPETAPGESTPCPAPSQDPTPGENRRGSGNRCGHDPKNPNFSPPDPTRPKIIQKAVEKPMARTPIPVIHWG